MQSGITTPKKELMKRIGFTIALISVICLPRFAVAQNSMYEHTSLDSLALREPMVGMFLAFIFPGAGHLYADEPGRAAAFFASEFALGVWIFKKILEGSVQAWFSSGRRGSVDISLPMSLLLCIKVFEIVDAGFAANRYNRKQGLTFRIEPDRIDLGWAFRF
jgi:hypothetical protein